jgi:hypothetical protein
MSTGVFRQYPWPRIPAPNVTAGTALGTPIGAGLVLGAYARATWLTRLVPLGIAALIPAAAQTLAPASLPAVARSAYPPQPVAPEFIAAFGIGGPDAPLPFSPVDWTSRPGYPVQEISPGIAPLLQVAPTAYIPPPALCSSAARIYPAPAPAPDFIAPLLGGDFPPGAPAIARWSVTATWTQLPAPRALSAAASDYCFPTPLRQAHRLPYPTQVLRVRYTEPGIPPVIPDFIDSKRLLAVTFNGRTLTVGQLGSDGPFSSLQVKPANRTVN